MNFLMRLIHDDMFLAVLAYLSIGLVFLLYFYYREKKWEADLARYEIPPVFVPTPAVNTYQPGTIAFNRHSDKLVTVVALNQEMQVIEGIPIDPDPEPETATDAVRSRFSTATSATILPFKRVQRSRVSSSQMH